jgi:lysophospholipase L1-like esterase
MRYIPLGDSCTYGNAVPAVEAWPNQLVAELAAEAAAAGREPPLELVGNLAVTDFTTRDVLSIELVQLESFRPEVSSILVGANDVVQGIGPDEYRRNLETILDGMEALVGRSRIFGLTIPDITITPAFPEHGDPAVLAPQLRAYNAIFSTVLDARGILFADIYDLSLAAAHDPTLIARDNLHPSGPQYALWVERIAPVVRGMLGI